MRNRKKTFSLQSAPFVESTGTIKGIPLASRDRLIHTIHETSRCLNRSLSPPFILHVSGVLRVYYRDKKDKCSAPLNHSAFEYTTAQ